MTEGEGAVIQILITPAESIGRKMGDYLAKQKLESNPKTANILRMPKSWKELRIKLANPGLYVVRIVVSSTSKESAEAHLGNIMSVFSQFELNSQEKQS
jgi:hypothetical protein